MSTILYSGYYNSELNTYPFQVDPNFFYLTSCDIPNLTILYHNNKQYILIDIPDSVFYDINDFKNKLNKCFHAEIINKKDFFFMLKNCELIYTLPNIDTHPYFSKLKQYPLDINTISSKLTKKRTIKFNDEIQSIKTACNHTSNGIKYILKHVYPNMSQIELIGLFKHSLSKKGIQELSFNPITSHNKYNQFLHYEAQDKKIEKKSLVLLDLGCKYNHYCSDISRCFPISGKFTNLQKDIYKIILNSLKYALKLMKPGNYWSDITQKVQLKLYDECLKIKLVSPIDNTQEKIQLIQLLMPHSLGHHVGLNNHDCDTINQLQKNMIIAVEPGIYFRNNIKSPHINKNIWNTYKHIGGIRLEDTIIITDKGFHNLSTITKEISGIESLMKKK